MSIITSLINWVQAGKFAKVLFGRFVVSARRAFFGGVAAKPDFFVILFNGCRPFTRTPIPRYALKSATGRCRAFGNIHVILAIAAQSKICAAIVKDVVIDVVNVIILGRAHDDPVHVAGLAVCISVNLAPLHVLKGFVIRAVNQCKFAVAECDFVCHVCKKYATRLSANCLPDGRLNGGLA